MSIAPGPVSRKPKVLAVDDTPANLVAMEVVLGDEYEMVHARSGEEALKILRIRHDIDVILLDVQMPGIDGFETARRIKATKSVNDIPIIFVTAIYKEDPFVKKGYEVGAIDYFGKPFDPEILRAKVGVYASFRMRNILLAEREQQLRASEELLRLGRKLTSVLKNLPVGALITDAAGRIEYVCQEVARILDVPILDASEYDRLFGWWDAEGLAISEAGSALSRALDTGESSSGLVLEIQQVSGTRTVLVSVSPLYHPQGKRVGALVLLQDVSEHRKTENDIEEQVARIIGTEAGGRPRTSPAKAAS